jgi:hypothetical protein
MSGFAVGFSFVFALSISLKRVISPPRLDAFRPFSGPLHSSRLVRTRSGAYKKNDQAWVEEKNGYIVRRLVGCGRLSGPDARNALAQLNASSRLYINFFQPSFKLQSKKRDGARVHKVYFAPATPCDRLLAHGSVEPLIKEKLKAQFKDLDPVRLLQEMRTAQQISSDLAA